MLDPLLLTSHNRLHDGRPLIAGSTFSQPLVATTRILLNVQTISFPLSESVLAERSIPNERTCVNLALQGKEVIMRQVEPSVGRSTFIPPLVEAVRTPERKLCEAVVF